LSEYQAFLPGTIADVQIEIITPDGEAISGGMVYDTDVNVWKFSWGSSMTEEGEYRAYFKIGDLVSITSKRFEI